jgi:hypothetical protein
MCCLADTLGMVFALETPTGKAQVTNHKQQQMNRGDCHESNIPKARGHIRNVCIAGPD